MPSRLSADDGTCVPDDFCGQRPPLMPQEKVRPRKVTRYECKRTENRTTVDTFGNFEFSQGDDFSTPCLFWRREA